MKSQNIIQTAQDRRLVITFIAYERMMDLLRLLLFQSSTVKYQARGIPFDADLVGVYSDYETQCLALVFRHPSFAEVPQGEKLPVLEITITTIRESVSGELKDA